MASLNENGVDDDGVGISVVDSKNADNVTLLLTAAKKGHLSTVKGLTQTNSVVVNAKDQYNNTALYIAAENEQFDIVKYLLDETDTDINAKNNGGQTVLHLAASTGNLSLVKSLLGKGADLNAKDDNSFGPLLYAAKHGHLNVIRYLIEEVGVNVNVICNFAARPLAAYHGHADVVQYLATKENDKVVIFNDRVSFVAAAQNGHFDIVRSLPEESLNFNSYYYGSEQNVLKLHVNSFILILDLYDMRKLLTEKNSDLRKIANIYYVCTSNKDDFKTYLLISTLHSGHKDILKYLIDEKHANVNARMGDLGTVLDYAVSAGFIDIVKYLIEEKNAEFKAEDPDGLTPLIFAVKHNQLDIVKFLVGKGAILNSKKHKALGVAAANGNFDMVKYLIKKGANVNEESGGGILYDFANFFSWNIEFYNVRTNIYGTPLYNAIQNGNLTIVKYLIKQGATVSNNAFNTAIEMGHLNIVKYLRDNWTFNIQNDEYKTAVDRALEKDHLNVVKYLVEKGTILSSDAVYYAVSSGNLDIVKFVMGKTVNTDYYAEALSNALVRGHLNIVRYLVDEKHVNIENGEILLARAIDSRKLNSVKYLVEEKQVDLHSFKIVRFNPWARSLFTYIVEKTAYRACDKDSFDHCLFGAISTGNLKLLKHLVNNKTNINFNHHNMYLSEKETILYKVLMNGNFDMASYVIEKGADVNFKNTYDKMGSPSNLTALHLAVANGEPSIVEYLLRKGADINAKTDIGLTPLGMAKLCCSTENANLLKSKGANLQRRSTKFEDLSKIDNASVDHDNEFADLHIVSSGSTKFSSWINVFANTVVQGLIGVSQYLYSSFKPSAIDTIQNRHSANSAAIQNGDITSTLLLLDVFVRQFTGQQYISTSELQITLIEATAVALRITEIFENKLKQAVTQYKISLESLNIEFIEAQKEVTRKLMSGKIDEISKDLGLRVEKAFNDKEFKGADKEKFMVEINKKIVVTLNKILQKPLANRDSTQDSSYEPKQHEVILGSKSLNISSASGHYCITDK